MLYKLSLLISLLLLSVLNHLALAKPEKSSASFQLEEATIQSIHTAIKKRQLTCEQLVQAYLDRIKKYNLSVDDKPPINAITEINLTALDSARQLDAAYTANKKLTGPLHCIPVILKDNIDSIDMTTTTGSFALLGTQPIQDAFLVARLRQAGAIILAKGGMDEFSWGMFGISSRSGRIGNAYDRNKNPGGSSGGPAAAVSANFAVLGIGTDNSGSVRIPAAFNGLVGLRPSTGLISQSGIFPMGNLDGIAGPMARTTTDLAIVLDVLAQTDATDKKTMGIPRIKTYTVFLNKQGLQGKRIGIVTQVGDMHTFKNMPDDIQKILQAAYQTMQQQGATLIEVSLPQFDNQRKFNQAGEIEDVDAYLTAFPATRQNFRDICESNRTKTFGDREKCLNFIHTMPSKNTTQYQQALNIFAKNKHYLHKIMAQYQLDALLIPISTQGIATYDAFAVNTWQAPVSSNSGLPAITIIIGYNKEKLPIGIELVGKQFNEGGLIELAYAYENRVGLRIAPTLPLSQSALANYSIAELNNLFTVIGTTAYEKVLKNSKLDPKQMGGLTPEIFKQLVVEELAK
ncbi:MAG TPA: amidase [Gammaproteobacteria bacterium]|jgi:aspartyl-tRNA(Asn)/glutamyl-tRNA(Gln) amidotransferase subunit A|nr:amidase [Gammaproteobacteria bacterium]